MMQSEGPAGSSHGGEVPVSPRRWMALAEIAVVSSIVFTDLLIPTLVVLAVAAVSLVVRRQWPRTIGLVWTRLQRRNVASISALVVVWTMLHLMLFMPVLEHLSGSRQDVGVFADVEGNLGLLLVLIGVSWTLAAFGEEVAYRGYLFTRIREAVGPGVASVVLAVVGPAVLFAVAHLEQGAVGVGLTFLDALLFGALRVHYGTVLAPIIAHGMSNTIGLIAFYFAGPIYGLW